jgi:hypothetical protein
MRHHSPRKPWSTFALVLAVLALGSILGCGGGESEPAESETAATDTHGTEAAATDQGGASEDVYRAGEALAATETVALANVIANPGDYQGKTVRIEAQIEQVCVKKGCWMILEDGEESVRVTFKDYGFFVPTDTKPGSVARIDAVVSVETISEEAARHYAEETEGGEPEKIEGPQEVVSVVAQGVEIDL